MAGKVNVSPPGEGPKIAMVRIVAVGPEVDAAIDNPQDIEPELLESALRALADDVGRTHDRARGMW